MIRSRNGLATLVNGQHRATLTTSVNKETRTTSKSA